MKFSEPRISLLVVDDDAETRDLFYDYLSSKYQVVTVSSAKEALILLEQQKFQIVITDLVMPHINGLELIQKIQKKYSYLSIIVISGKATIETAVKAIKLGAEEVLIKPIRDFEILDIMLKKIIDRIRLVEENKRLQSILNQNFNRKIVIGSGFAIQSALRMVQKVAPLDTTVLITGETGVGKSLFAKLIHENSERKDKQFVTVNCGSIPETLLESHLFGHKKGAFTDAVREKNGFFIEADGGTLFLDEITETSIAFQVKLLHVLETSTIRKVGGEKDITIDTRVIVATNKELKSQVKAAKFRKDLYYRLNVINIKIPPLRERKDDILELAHYYLNIYAKKYEKKKIEFSENVKQIFLNVHWDGNVRELRNVVERAVILSEKNIITLKDIPPYLSNISESFIPTIFFDKNFSKAKANFEKTYFESLLKQTNGNISKMSKISGLVRQNIYPKLKSLHIDPQKYR